MTDDDFERLKKEIDRQYRHRRFLGMVCFFANLLFVIVVGAALGVLLANG